MGPLEPLKPIQLSFLQAFEYLFTGFSFACLKLSINLQGLFVVSSTAFSPGFSVTQKASPSASRSAFSSFLFPSYYLASLFNFQGACTAKHCGGDKFYFTTTRRLLSRTFCITFAATFEVYHILLWLSIVFHVCYDPVWKNCFQKGWFVCGTQSAVC